MEEISANNKFPYVFQVDSSIIKEYYNNNPNYKIIENQDGSEDLCIIYFSGHGIYFPNNEKSFTYSIVEKDYYEWSHLKIPNAKKHIYLRDIHKQWYLTGINSQLNSCDKVAEFLLKESKGLRIITVGSSAGGYAAILFGELLKAERVIAFSPRIELLSRLELSSHAIDPLVFRLIGTPYNKYMDLLKSLSLNKSEFYLFYPIKSKLDSIQLEHLEKNNICNNKRVHLILFNTSKHGVPFPKIVLTNLFALSNDRFKDLFNRQSHIYNSISFSIKMVGFIKTLKFTIMQSLMTFLKKIRQYNLRIQ